MGCGLLMRSAKSDDYWNDVYKDSRRYSNYIKELSFIDCNGYTGSVELTPGITVICGLNGAGKSSIVSSIKEMLGLNESSVISKNKFNGQVSAKIMINRQLYEISSNITAISCGMSVDNCIYIDSDLAIESLKYWNQNNIGELLEGIEENTFSKEELYELSNLVGKTYKECVSYEIEDATELYLPVFFKVKDHEIEYDSIGMGIGEHFILYLYYVLENINNDSILIIEEPESYISVLSQQRLLDYIAKIISKKKISVILTTHSPHILKKVKPDNVIIISNRFGKINFDLPNTIQDAKEHLGIEYYKTESNVATIFVEDNISRLFLDCILKEENPLISNIVDIVYVGGHTKISARLAFDDSEYMTHKLIGIYDDDVKTKNDFNEDDLKWSHLFLPIKECVEKEIIDFLGNEHNEITMSTALNIQHSKFLAILSKREGEDHHDWFINICKDLDITPKSFVKKFYLLWKENNEKKIKDFLSALSKILFEEDEKDLLVKKQYVCSI